MLELYSGSLALLSDLYQFTMAYGFWKHRLHETKAIFNLFFRKNPFGGNAAIAAGLETAIEFIERFRFDDSDITYLASLNGANGKPLFEQEFLDWLKTIRFEGNIDAVPEGQIVFAHQPLLRIEAPIGICQILETPLLNILNFQTLIATKTRRIVTAAAGDPVLEFGLRRAQHINGAIAATRAAIIGGCVATSNVLAGKIFQIPVRGTHAHSWVMAFSTESEAFERYADALPNNCTFLVDTYDTIEGIQHAIQQGLRLRKQGYELLGIRLDSGDLAQLSIQARQLLDEAGFSNAAIVASNDLDEFSIIELKSKGAKINVWAVGTNLVTAKDQPALGGVYKLGAIQEGNNWSYRIKLSEQPIKISNPGALQVTRIYDEYGMAAGDLLWNELEPFNPLCVTNENGKPLFDTRTASQTENLLAPVIKQGKRVYPEYSLTQIQQHSAKYLQKFSEKFFYPEQIIPYASGISAALYDFKQRLIQSKQK
ncbi:MAG: nicotinate phosphoribosyltransferase [Bacteroidia bacterium]|nr:nicotinate phosphoribosyltransferase [Bacteroidia bacterium]